MATWTDITNASVQPKAPVTSELVTALRDNPTALAEGAAGAPRVDSDAAIDWGGNGVGTSNGELWVRNRTSEVGVGEVGTYAFMEDDSGDVNSPGDTRAASVLSYVGVEDGGVISNAGTPTGTWRLMGYSSAVGVNVASLWLRVS